MDRRDPGSPQPPESTPRIPPAHLSQAPLEPHRLRRSFPSTRRIGLLAAGLTIFVLTAFPDLVHLPGRLVAWAQRGEAAYLPATLRDAPLGPDQPPPTATGGPPPSATAATPAPPGQATLPPPYPVPWPPPPGPDALAEALALLQTNRGALGYRPVGDWTRFPLPSRTPYLLPMFEPVYSDPLRLYAAARTLGTSADRWLHPYQVKDAGLYRATYYLGFDRKVGNFREYSANVLVEPAASDPLREAVRDVYQYAREDLAHYTFGSVIPSAAEDIMARELAALPAPLQLAVARALVNQLDAIRWRDRGLRNVPPEFARKAFAIRDLGDTQGDGAFYYPEIDDVMRDLDEPSLYYAGQKAVETAQQLRMNLAVLADADRCPPRMVEIPTPFGRLVIGTCGSDEFRGDDILLSVDPGGDDVHADNAGGTTAIEIPVALSVDLGGDDNYVCGAVRGACQGAGVLGAGVLVDGTGDDAYGATHNAQGLGYLGMGLLFDGEGQDAYQAYHSAQGTGYFGYGALLDGSGNDAYHILFDGQGYGGVGGGVGVLADRSGNDVYHAEPDVRELPPEYQYRNYAGNGQPNTVVSFVQGASAGRRGDGSDGHSWPGGLGALVDVMGDDRYQAGAFAQAYGYWYGIGMMYDGAGNDEYKSVYYSIASGAHYSASAIIDEEGNDVFQQEQTIANSTAGAGVAFAWDYVVSLIFDRSGDDRYESNANCLGRSAEKGNAYLIDGGGADTYVGGANADGTGRADCVGSSGWRALFGVDPYRQYLTGFESGVFSLLMDLGGTDTYLAKNFATGATTPHNRARDGATWYNPNPDDTTTGAPAMPMTYRQASFYGLGIDRPDGRIPEFDRIPPAITPVPTATAAPGVEAGPGTDGGQGIPGGPGIEAPPGDPAWPGWPGPDPVFDLPDRGPRLPAAPTAEGGG
jgi:hypothetical protein